MSIYKIGASHISRPRTISIGTLFTVRPPANGSSLVEYTTGSGADVANGVARWVSWPHSRVSKTSADLVTDNGFVRVTSFGGVTEYEIDENPTAVSLASMTADWGSTEQTPYATGRRYTVASIGDSIATYYAQQGLQFATPGTIPGVQSLLSTITCPAGNGTLSFFGGDRSFQWTAPGDAPGPRIPVDDGIFYVPSATPGYDLRIPVTKRLLPTADVTAVIASTNRVWLRASGSIQGVADAFTNRRFNFLSDYGIGGNYTSDMLTRQWQALGVQPDILWEISGATNDIVAAGRTPASVIDNRIAMWGLAAGAGIPVIANTVTPRAGQFGPSSTSNAADFGVDPAVVNPLFSQINAALAREARTRKNVYLADVWTNLIDPATGRIRNGSSGDGLHPSGDMAIEMAIPAVNYLNTLVPMIQPVPNVGNFTSYSASTNPTGGLLPGAQAYFGGTGGTLGTGASLTPAWSASMATVADVTHCISSGNLYRATQTGTAGAVAPAHMAGTAQDGTTAWLFLSAGVSAGWAAGYTMQRSAGAAVTVTTHKVADPAGGPDWQEMIISGATVNEKDASAESIRLFPGLPSFANIAIGDIIDTAVQVQLPYSGGPNLYGMVIDQQYGGASLIHENTALFRCARGIRWSEPFTLALDPIPVIAGVTSIQPRVTLYARQARTSYVRMRNFDVRKVIA